MAFSALLVPVPSADWLVLDRVPERRGLLVPAHVTLLTPFVPLPDLTDGVVSELADLFGDVVPFPFRLRQVCQFPDGTVYLAPDPAAPFRQLTSAIGRAFPEHPPYEGRFDSVVPHVTVPLAEGEGVTTVEALMAEHGPVDAHAREAQLVWIVGPDLEVVESFPFGVTAA
jgi:hypothetical protein